MTMDLSLLQTLMGGDDRLVTRFITIFKTQVPQQVASLPQLYENGEWETLSTTLHGLKTQFSYVGLADLAEQMRHLEALVDQGDTSSAGPQLAVFQDTFDHFWATAFPAG